MKLKNKLCPGLKIKSSQEKIITNIDWTWILNIYADSN